MSRLKKVLGICNFPGCLKRGRCNFEMYNGSKKLRAEKLCPKHADDVVGVLSLFGSMTGSRIISIPDTFDVAEEFRKAVRE